MAEELDGTEMLRSDFINNFSHEFKTPIVSIAGFAKLLKHGNLTEEQRMEYLDIIEEEAMRLSAMATNVLNMTKVENQTILANVTKFNLSEQLRNSVLVLEPKWTKKQTELNVLILLCGGMILFTFLMYARFYRTFWREHKATEEEMNGITRDIVEKFF